MLPPAVVVMAFCCGLARAVFHADESKLRAYLFAINTYNYKIRPSQTVSVYISFSLRSITQLDIKSHTFAMTGWFKMTWSDPRLVWVPSTYGGISDIFDTELAIWRPLVMVDNSISSVAGILQDDKLLLRVSNNGTVTWEPPGVFLTHCDLDISYYPFDTQSCVVELTTWGYSTDEVSSEVASDGISLNAFQDNGEWEIVETRVEQKTVDSGRQSRSQLDFVIKVRRKSLFYVLNIIVPVVVMSLLSVLVFLVPVESGEKVTYALTVLLSYAVLMTIVSDNMPATSKNASVLSIYLTFCLAVNAASTVLTVCVLRLHHQLADNPCRFTWVTHVAVSCLARFSGLEPATKDSNDSVIQRSVKIAPISDKTDDNDTSGAGAEKPAKDEVEAQTVVKPDCEYLTGKQIAAIVNAACCRMFLSLVLFCTFLFLLVLVGRGYYP